MIPISDDNPARLKPVFTWSIILLCIGVFFWQLLALREEDADLLLASYGFVPRDFFSHAGMSLTPWLTLFTSMFMHGGFLHLGGNMLYLWIFGNNVEDPVGPLKYLIFYLLCGFLGSATHVFF